MYQMRPKVSLTQMKVRRCFFFVSKNLVLKKYRLSLKFPSYGQLKGKKTYFLHEIICWISELFLKLLACWKLYGEPDMNIIMVKNVPISILRIHMTYFFSKALQITFHLRPRDLRLGETTKIYDLWKTYFLRFLK